MTHKAATEEEVAKLHKLITTCHNMKLDAVLELAQQFMNIGNMEAVMEIINTRDMGPAQKWVEYNGVSSIAASEDGETELGRKLRLIKEAQEGKVVPFRDEDELTG